MKIALVNSTLAAVPAAAQAVQRVCADAELWSLLDERLQQDVEAQDGRISDATGDASAASSITRSTAEQTLSC